MMANYWAMSAMGGVLSGTIGVQGHYANGLAALYLACGQDVACVAESAVGVTRFEVTDDGDLYAARHAAESHRRHGRRGHGAAEPAGVPRPPWPQRHRAARTRWRRCVRRWRWRASCRSSARSSPATSRARTRGWRAGSRRTVRRRRRTHQRRDGHDVAGRRPRGLARWTSTSASGSRCSRTAAHRRVLVWRGLLLGAAAGVRRAECDHRCPLPSLVVAFVSCLLFFFQLRVADEFKDHEEDTRWRPYRPVPRGLVTLRELGWLAVASAVIQLSLALWLAPALVGPLLLVWVYAGLMTKEFWVKEWLRAASVHGAVVAHADHAADRPVRDGVRLARGRLRIAAGLGLLWFLIASFFNGMVVEVGRKIRSPADEEAGVQTYSRHLGSARGRAGVVRGHDADDDLRAARRARGWGDGHRRSASSAVVFAAWRSSKDRASCRRNGRGRASASRRSRGSGRSPCTSASVLCRMFF